MICPSFVQKLLSTYPDDEEEKHRKRGTVEEQYKAVKHGQYPNRSSQRKRLEKSNLTRGNERSRHAFANNGNPTEGGGGGGERRAGGDDDQH